MSNTKIGFDVGSSSLKIAVVQPPSQVICRMVTMPRMTTQQLMMNLPYEFADFIQGGPDQYFCDYALCDRAEGEDEEGVPMMAAVAAKQHLEGQHQMFARAGVKLKTIVPQEMALIQLVQRCRERIGGEEYCFVDLGHQYTRITAVWRDRVQATRQIAMAGRRPWRISRRCIRGISAISPRRRKRPRLTAWRSWRCWTAR